MKKRLLFIIPLLFSCSSNQNYLSFKENEYILKDGDSIKVEQNNKGVIYELIGDVPSGVSLSKEGVIHFDNSIPNYTQVLAIAKYNNLVSNEIVLTLYYDYLASSINFINQIDYIVNGEMIKATDSNNYGISYYLKNDVKGISINKSSGKVQYTSIVEDNIPFIVVAKSGNNNLQEHTFYTVTKNTIGIKNKIQINHINTNLDNSYYLDFTNYSSIENDNIVSLCDSNNKIISSNNYEYKINEKKLILKSNYINTLKTGEHIFKIITKRNAF